VRGNSLCSATSFLHPLVFFRVRPPFVGSGNGEVLPQCELNVFVRDRLIYAGG
jgi:hypothetical protein